MKFKLIELDEDGKEIGEFIQGNIPSYVEAESYEMVNEPHSGNYLQCLTELLLQMHNPPSRFYAIAIYENDREIYRSYE